MTSGTSETERSNLSQILHAAAQPLTILRASFYKGSIDRMSLDEIKELAASSAVQIERVCAFFGFLQELAELETIEASLFPTELPRLLDHVLDGVNQLFLKRGVKIGITLPNPCGLVMVDEGRTSRALLTILLNAYSMSRSKDSVELIASTGEDTIEVRVRNSRWNGDPMTAESCISMGLARANLQTQRATLSWSQEPFDVRIELKKAPILHEA